MPIGPSGNPHSIDHGSAFCLNVVDRQVAANEGIPAGFTLFPSTRVLGEAEYSVDPETLVGDNDQEFDLGASAEGTVLGVDPAPIDGLAKARLGTRVTNGWSLQPGSVTSEVGTPAVLGTTIAYPVSIRAMSNAPNSSTWPIRRCW